MPIIRMKAIKDEDDVERFVQSSSALERNMDSWEPPVPYHTMGEYTSRLESFLGLQEELFRLSYPNLNFRPMTNLLMGGDLADKSILDELLKPYFNTLYGRNFSAALKWDGPILQKVLGEDWVARACHQEAQIHEEDMFGIFQRTPRELFQPEKILFTWDEDSSRNLYHNILIEKTAYIDEELGAAVSAALNLYETLDFSSHLYGGRFFGPNPCGDYLETLTLIIGALASQLPAASKLPEGIKKSIVLGWYPTHMPEKKCLRVEMPIDRPSYIDPAEEYPSSSAFKIQNVDYVLSKEYLSAGDKVWCMPRPYEERYALLLSKAED